MPPARRRRRATRCRPATWSSISASSRRDRSASAHALHIEPLYEERGSILGDPIRPETLWSCMQCMACVEICPVGIEHVPIINQMRRRLVEQGEMDSMLQQTLETIYTSGNSFGEAKRKRARWAKELDFEVKDMRKEPAEHLWFVGDYASFDPRNQRNTQALARILHHAGVDFGILFDAEKTGGCDVRRAGEEGLYASLAEENMKTISGCSFDRIFSSDPAHLPHASERVSGLRRQLGRRPPLPAPARADRGRAPTAAKRARLPRHLPRPVHARPLQRRLRRAAPGARSARHRARRDAAQPRQLLLLRRGRRPDLDEGAEGGGRAQAERAADRRGRRARRASTTSSSPARRT